MSLAAPKKRRKHRPHWYRQYLYECPVCGRSEVVRERVYGRKPKDSRRVYIWAGDVASYDGCLY